MKHTLSLIATLAIACPAMAGWNHMNLGFTWSGDNPPTKDDYKHVLKGEIYDYKRGTDGKRFTYTGVYKTGGKYTPKDAMEIRKSGAKNPTMAPDQLALFNAVIASYQKGKKDLLKKLYKYPVDIAAAHIFVNQNAATFIKLPIYNLGGIDSTSFESEIITEDEPSGVNTESKPTDGWIAIYRGKVVAPKDMTFRFFGAADDYMSVTFDNKLVLETGFQIPMQNKGNGYKDPAADLPLRSEYQEKIRNGLEHNHKGYILVKYKSTQNSNNAFGGITGGTPITVKKGEVYPIEIIVGNVSGGYYYYLMTLEATEDNHNKPVLFRTSNQHVAHSSTFRSSNEGGPHYDCSGEADIWRIASGEDDEDSDSKQKKKKKKKGQGDKPLKRFKKV